MHWHGHFRAAFFAAWTAAGLPDPQDHAARYEELMAAVAPPAVAGGGRDGPLAAAIVQRVHAFGVMIGTVMGDLLGLPEDSAAERAAWCGRFNLAISLFDYVCDESGRGDVLATVPPFSRFEPDSTSGNGDPLRPEEAVVARLAAELVGDLERAFGDRAGVFAALSRMYRAEREVAASRPGPGFDADGVRRSLFSKSAEPFRVMAMWMVHDAPEPALEEAARLGEAIGGCYWLVDDARDLWTDFDNDQWNLFALAAARAEPRLLAVERDPLRDAHVSRLLVETDAAGTEARRAVGELAAAVGGLGAEPSHPALGVMAASLAAW